MCQPQSGGSQGGLGYQPPRQTTYQGYGQPKGFQSPANGPGNPYGSQPMFMDTSGLQMQQRASIDPRGGFAQTPQRLAPQTQSPVSGTLMDTSGFQMQQKAYTPPGGWAPPGQPAPIQPPPMPQPPAPTGPQLVNPAEFQGQPAHVLKNMYKGADGQLWYRPGGEGTEPRAFRWQNGQFLDDTQGGYQKYAKANPFSDAFTGSRESAGGAMGNFVNGFTFAPEGAAQGGQQFNQWLGKHRGLLGV